jgi:Cytochrome c554 and c-prime
MTRLALLLCLAPAALASDLVGPASCRTCHAEAYRIWSAGPHARAAQALLPDQRKQPLCLQCHSRDEQREGQADVQGVSCETCHGAGRWYQPAMVMRDKELSRLFGLTDPTPQSCLVCHGGQSPSLKPFDVKEAMQRIDHWTADRAARKPKLSLRLEGRR